MKLTKIASVFLAVLLVASAGVAAMPGNAPADSQAGQADDHHSDDADAPAANAANASDDRNGQGERDRTDENHTDGSAAEASADERRGPPADADQRRGPPTDMPAQVPDFVTQIHDLVDQKLDGTIDHLGQMIADVTPGEDAGQPDQVADGAHGDDHSDDEQSAAEQGSDDGNDDQQSGDTTDADEDAGQSEA